MNFEQSFFDAVVERSLFYSPKIEIKPVHLANGLFRAVCGCVSDDKGQHSAVSPRLVADGPAFEGLDGSQRKAVHQMLATLLGADRALYGKPNFSSYTLSHATHVTRDNHDRDAGEWLCAILTQGAAPHPAYDLLRTLLLETDKERSDELSVLSLPVSPPLEALKQAKGKLAPEMWPTSLAVDPQTGDFHDPLLRSVRRGFDRLAEHEQELARYGGKLDALHRLAVWGCLALYLHLANSGREHLDQRVPLLLCLDASLPTLKQASIQTYQAVSRSLDRFFHREIARRIEVWAAEGADEWDDDAANKERVRSMTWKKLRRGGPQVQRSESEFADAFIRFYESYRSEAAEMAPRAAFARAATDMLDLFLSATPASVARALGVRIGLLTSSRRQTEKLYSPEAPLLELLVRATVPPGVTRELPSLAREWATEYGILFGALGDENERLAAWEIEAVAGDEYQRNREEVVTLLEQSGYARRYADGVVLVETPGIGGML